MVDASVAQAQAQQTRQQLEQQRQQAQQQLRQVREARESLPEITQQQLRSSGNGLQTRLQRQRLTEARKQLVGQEKTLQDISRGLSRFERESLVPAERGIQEALAEQKAFETAQRFFREGRDPRTIGNQKVRNLVRQLQFQREFAERDFLDRLSTQLGREVSSLEEFENLKDRLERQQAEARPSRPFFLPPIPQDIPAPSVGGVAVDVRQIPISPLDVPTLGAPREIFSPALGGFVQDTRAVGTATVRPATREEFEQIQEAELTGRAITRAPAQVLTGQLFDVQIGAQQLRDIGITRSRLGALSPSKQLELAKASERLKDDLREARSINIKAKSLRERFDKGQISQEDFTKEVNRLARNPVWERLQEKGQITTPRALISGSPEFVGGQRAISPQAEFAANVGISGTQVLGFFSPLGRIAGGVGLLQTGVETARDPTLTETQRRIGVATALLGAGLAASPFISAPRLVPQPQTQLGQNVLNVARTGSIMGLSVPLGVAEGLRVEEQTGSLAAGLGAGVGVGGTLLFAGLGLPRLRQVRAERQQRLLERAGEQLQRQPLTIRRLETDTGGIDVLQQQVRTRPSFFERRILGIRPTDVKVEVIQPFLQVGRQRTLMQGGQVFVTTRQGRQIATRFFETGGVTDPLRGQAFLPRDGVRVSPEQALQIGRSDVFLRGQTQFVGDIRRGGVVTPLDSFQRTRFVSVTTEPSRVMQFVSGRPVQRIVDLGVQVTPAGVPRITSRQASLFVSPEARGRIVVSRLSDLGQDPLGLRQTFERTFGRGAVAPAPSPVTAPSFAAPSVTPDVAQAAVRATAGEAARQAVTPVSRLFSTESLFTGTGVYERSEFAASTLGLALRDRQQQVDRVQPITLDLQRVEPLTIQTPEVTPLVTPEVGQELAPVLSIASDTRTAQVPQVDVTPAQVQTPVVDLRLDTRTQQELRQAQRLGQPAQVPRDFFAPSPPPVSPALVPTPDGVSRRDLLFGMVEDDTPFDIFVKKRGQGVDVGDARTLGQAKKILKKELRETLSASGFITKDGKKIKFKDLGIINKDFRPSRNKKDPWSVVEKKNRRLKERTETREIVSFRNLGLNPRRRGRFSLL